MKSIMFHRTFWQNFVGIDYSFICQIRLVDRNFKRCSDQNIIQIGIQVQTSILYVKQSYNFNGKFKVSIKTSFGYDFMQ